MKIPMVNLRLLLIATERQWLVNVRDVFERSQYILGQEVDTFERELAAAFGAKFAVGVGSGTSAIELGMRAAGLGGTKAEVLVPALTSPYTAQAVLAAGCVPRFVDVDPETLLLDPAAAEARITKRTRAIVPVHLYGQPCPAPLRSGLTIVHDACQAHGGSYAGKPFTRTADAVAYSFYPTKNLFCLGDGGAVLTDSKRIAAQLRLLRDGGRRNDQISRIPAVNSRLDEIQACCLRAGLTKLIEWNADRVKLAEAYDAMLAGCPGIHPVKRAVGSVCHLYVVRAKRRERLRKFLADRGIATGVHYPVPLHLQPAFHGCGQKRGDLPVAERACRQILSLPLWPGMEISAVEQVAAACAEFGATA